MTFKSSNLFDISYWIVIGFKEFDHIHIYFYDDNGEIRRDNILFTSEEIRRRKKKEKKKTLKYLRLMRFILVC